MFLMSSKKKAFYSKEIQKQLGLLEPLLSLFVQWCGHRDAKYPLDRG